MLAAGALVGIVVGLGAQALVGGVDEEIRGLVRVALLLPAGIFVAWWLLVPGISLDRGETEPDVDGRIDVAAKVERIEAAFDETAVPRVGGHRVTPPEGAVREELRNTIRRPQASADTSQFGLRRPTPPTTDRERASGG